MTRQRQAMAQAYAHLLNSHMQLQPHVRVPPHTIVAGVELALIDLGEVSLGLQGHKHTVRGFKLGGSSGPRSLRLHPQAAPNLTGGSMLPSTVPLSSCAMYSGNSHRPGHSSVALHSPVLMEQSCGGRRRGMVTESHALPSTTTCRQPNTCA